MKNTSSSVFLELFNSIKQNNVKKVEKLAPKVFTEGNINAKNLGEGLLHQACREKNPKIVEILLKNGAQADELNKEGFAPLHIAVATGNCETVSLLFEAHANPNIVNQSGLGPLSMLPEENSLKIAKILVAHGAQINQIDDNKTPAFFYAALLEDLDLIKFLFQEKADLNVTTKAGNVLHEAIKSSVNRQIVAFLIQNGANPNTKDEQGNTPLHLAALEGNYEITELLINANADPNITNQTERPPLSLLAAPRYEVTIAKLLVKAGAKVNLLDSDGHTPIFCATCFNTGYFNNFELAKFLLSEGADLHMTINGNNILHEAIKVGAKLKAIEFLIQNNVDIRCLAPLRSG